VELNLSYLLAVYLPQRLISAQMEGFEDFYYYGRRPTAVMMPNFRNVHQQETDFLRGYMTLLYRCKSRLGASSGEGTLWR
jgi:hypothetical protein